MQRLPADSSLLFSVTSQHSTAAGVFTNPYLDLWWPKTGFEYMLRFGEELRPVRSRFLRRALEVAERRVEDKLSDLLATKKTLEALRAAAFPATQDEDSSED